MPERDDSAAYRPRAERPIGLWLILLLALAAAGWFGWQWWQKRQAGAPSAPPVAAAPAPADAAPPAPAPAPEPAGPQNPVDALAKPDENLPPLASADAKVRAALVELLGARPVSQFLNADDFVRRFVATVDALPREHAPARVWPTQRTGGRLATQGEGEAMVLSPDNGARYTPFVLFAESVDPARAAAVYARLYPLFQQAYEELGYPNRYFNDQMVAAIDHLLAAPEPAGPVRLKRVEFKGDNPADPVQVRIEFADGQLERLSAGQKLMVRVGLVNERRLKAQLRALRGHIAAKK